MQFLGPDSIALQSVYKALVSTFMWSTPSLLDDEAASMHYETREILSDLRGLVFKDRWEEHGIQTTKDFLMEMANGGLDLRPEKCPITTCEYHTKGFARKYDKNRHTLSHYRGVLACPFCPGIDTPAQKSFSRADVLKRHLTSAHGVDQAPPSMWNSMAPDTVASGKKGKCSICKKEYDGPQAFYEHLNDCVLAVIAPAALVGTCYYDTFTITWCVATKQFHED
ncbi:hypothetical protein LAWI1_G005753 [Lachnellula willkommii]|uniref:C2H2-type domain-containing protein n=1 Tax=Lachnellula willkommii TaxID=215461 RepID=A0A559MI42_9HELO|nr:hypothetical protein LAWI1_G005753 [Lachnellula willkommii]